MKVIVLPLLCSVFLFACTHDNTNPQPAVRFSQDIQPIIKRSCATTGCHAGNGGEFSLDSYNEIITKVEPGNARGSELYRVLTHRASEIMPPEPATLADADITKIYLWIEAGAKND